MRAVLHFCSECISIAGMDIQDVIFDPEVSMDLKHAILQLMADEHIRSGFTPILVPTSTNDDVNGSQHASNGGTDFTYRDADMDDVQRATTLGYYEYFSNYGVGYTGHYYNGDGRHFDAIVLDPPAYAVSHTV